MEYTGAIVEKNVELLISLGFRDLGYDIVLLDDAMTELKRAADGSLVENKSKFPKGLQKLSDDLHAANLKFGVYSSAGSHTCGGYPGSLGYETQDAEWWASLGADLLKYDNCYNDGQSGTPKLSYDRYKVMSDALIATGRDFTYLMCNWGDDKPWEWASTITNAARMSGDIHDSYAIDAITCPCGPDEFYCQLPGYQCSMMNILGKAAAMTSKNQPGYWNDLDMLNVGLGGMTYDEYKTQMSMWSAIKSPLIMGNKLDEIKPDDYAILINPALIAINQDAAGSAIQRRFRYQIDDKDDYGFGEIQIWSGNLANGDAVVAYINGGNSTQTISKKLLDVFGGIRTDPKINTAWDLYDVWGNQTVMPTNIAAQVLKGSMKLTDAPASQYYFNASATTWAQGVANENPLLLGTPAGHVGAGGILTADVPRHGVQMWRLRPAKGSSQKSKTGKDEL